MTIDLYHVSSEHVLIEVTARQHTDTTLSVGLPLHFLILPHILDDSERSNLGILL